MVVLRTADSERVVWISEGGGDTLAVDSNLSEVSPGSQTGVLPVSDRPVWRAVIGSTILGVRVLSEIGGPWLQSIELRFDNGQSRVICGFTFEEGSVASFRRTWMDDLAVMDTTLEDFGSHGRDIIPIRYLSDQSSEVGTPAHGVGRGRKALATAVTVVASAAYFLMTATSEYRFHEAVFWTMVLAAPILFALGPRKGLLQRLGLGFAWMVTVTLVTMLAVLGVILVASLMG
ncbi:MAG: hypothetical protein JWL76_1961 [Thermoleophilia bacterium]|nr:hypothetical protein [Thermoleophilia bacterium]